MIKYLIVGFITVGILSGCQEGYTVTAHKGKILSMSGDHAEVIYQTTNGDYREIEYDFDNYSQRDAYHTGEKIVCYVRNNGYVQEIAKD
jgi:hypothetical protein